MAEQKINSSNEIVNRYESENSKFSEFLKKIPIIREAYTNAEYLKADNHIRAELKAQLQKIKENVIDVSEKLVRKKKSEALEFTELIENKLTEIIGKVQYSGSGSNKSFKPTEEQMDALVNYDQSLIKISADLTDEVTNLIGKVFELTNEKIEETSDVILDKLKEFQNKFEKRQDEIGTIS